MNETVKISGRSLLSASRSHVSSDLDGEAVILNLEEGVYYGLNQVGARIWSLIQEPRTFNQVLEILLAEYDVEPEVCRREASDLIEELIGHGLIEVQDGDPA